MKVDLLSKEEEQALAYKARAGDVDARNRIIMGFYPLICRAAKKLARKHHRDPEDLVQFGIAHIIERFHGFKPELGYRASTYFVLGTVRKMAEYIKHNARIINLPAHVSRKEYSGGKYKKIAEKARRCGSLDGEIFAGDTVQPVKAADLLTDKSAPPPDALPMEKEFRIWFYGCLEQLRESDRELILMRMEGLTYDQIGLRRGLSKQRVEQILKTVYRRLRSIMSGIDDVRNN